MRVFSQTSVYYNTNIMMYTYKHSDVPIRKFQADNNVFFSPPPNIIVSYMSSARIILKRAIVDNTWLNNVRFPSKPNDRRIQYMADHLVNSRPYLIQIIYIYDVITVGIYIYIYIL